MYRKRIFNRKILYCAFVFVFVSLFTMSIAYAALSVSLKVSGNAEIFSSNWDIYLENPSVTEGSITNEPPTITSWNTMKFDLEFENPGDFYEFVVIVVNDGDLDAMISDVTKTPELTTAQAKFIKYDITYYSGVSITTNHALPAKSSVPIKVRIEYRDDLASLDDLPTTETSLSMSLSLTYIQADENITDVPGYGFVGTGGSLDDIGTIVTIGPERFYTIGTEGDNVKLLAMHNLYAGGYVEKGRDENNESYEIYHPYGDEANGLQNPNMLGYDQNMEGVLAFSETYYWENIVNEYPAYVYDSNSNLYPHIENYKEFIEMFDVEVIEARLINYEELTQLGCDDIELSELDDEYDYYYVVKNLCNNTPTWLYSSAYWTGVSVGEGIIMSVENEDGPAVYFDPFSEYEYNGIRPVLVVPKDDIPR